MSQIPLPDDIPVAHLTSYRRGYEDASRRLRSIIAAGTPRERVGAIKWMVIRKRETDPVEVWQFEEEEDARVQYEQVAPQWTETFLCKIVIGPYPI